MANKVIVVMWIIFIIIGIAMITTYYANLKNQTAETIATVTKVETGIDSMADNYKMIFYPIVKYIVDNKTYERRLPDVQSSNSSTFKIGEEIIIIYNPNNPENINMKGNNIRIICRNMFYSIWYYWNHVFCVFWDTFQIH